MTPEYISQAKHSATSNKQQYDSTAEHVQVQSFSLANVGNRQNNVENMLISMIDPGDFDLICNDDEKLGGEVAEIVNHGEAKRCRWTPVIH